MNVQDLHKHIYPNLLNICVFNCLDLNVLLAVHHNICKTGHTISFDLSPSSIFTSKLLLYCLRSRYQWVLTLPIGFPQSDIRPVTLSVLCPSTAVLPQNILISPLNYYNHLIAGLTCLLESSPQTALRVTFLKCKWFHTSLLTPRVNPFSSLPWVLDKDKLSTLC